MRAESDPMCLPASLVLYAKMLPMPRRRLATTSRCKSSPTNLQASYFPADLTWRASTTWKVLKYNSINTTAMRAVAVVRDRIPRKRQRFRDTGQKVDDV